MPAAAQAESFLQRQAAAWRAASTAVSTLLQSLASLHDGHKAGLLASDSGTVDRLEAARAVFCEHDGQREAALAAAVQVVQQACSERRLDETVAAALAALDELEAGYR